ncbi:MAG: phosphodiester glycosidase family protein [Nitrososphaerales archaeon]
MSAKIGTRSARSLRRPAYWALAGAIVLVACLAASILGGPRFIQAHPDAVTNTVDWVRNIVGPGPVATIENTYYRVVDMYDQWRYHATGQAAGWSLNASVSAPSSVAVGAFGSAGVSTPAAGAAISQKGSPAEAPTRPQVASGQNQPARGKPTGLAMLAPVQQHASSAAPAFAPPPNVTPLLASPALRGEGVWQPLTTLGQPAGAPPLLWQTVLRPDPGRPYAAVALVAMDLSRSQVHIVAGAREPASTVPDRGLRTGAIPDAVQTGGRLLAAWNGGFKAVHGHYGMMTDGVVWLPAKDGMATAAVDADGRLTIGAWGRGVKPDQAWVAWRQNNPPLIEDGVIDPDVIRLANTVRWGASLDGAVFIWRSGMGITRDGRWLIYAAGNSLSVQTLTTALQAAGAYNAMQLDVNMSFERFDLFSPAPQAVRVAGRDVTLPVTAVKLISQMLGGPALFLVPYDRDFFYLTAQP